MKKNIIRIQIDKFNIEIIRTLFFENASENEMIKRKFNMLKGLALNYDGSVKVKHIIKRLMIDIRQAQENLKWFVFPVEETLICEEKKRKNTEWGYSFKVLSNGIIWVYFEEGYKTPTDAIIAMIKIVD